jgi:hypothetical protein
MLFFPLSTVKANFRIVCWAILLFLTIPASAQTTVLFSITNSWRYNQTQNLDSDNWQAPGYPDSGWPSGRGLLYSETNTVVSPRNTALTLGRTTYYFRSGFNFSGDPQTSLLTFSNKIDDGAVFYINGTEVGRIRMPVAPTAVNYATFATGTPPGGDATAWDVFSIPATNVVIGTNVIAVELHQQSSGSSDVVFGTALSFSPIGAVTITRGPYLQMGTSTNITVRWRTDQATNSIVRYGLDTNFSFAVTNSGARTDHVVLLTNLLPDTKYYYSVGRTGATLAGGDTNHFFVTSPVPGTSKPTRIWVLGDSGTANDNQRAVRNAYYNFNGSRYTDLWLMLGDNAYDNGTDVEYQAGVFDIYPEVLRQSVVWPTLGNHDTAQSTAYNDNYPYFNIFTLPTNGIAGGVASGTEHYYSFDYANIHFICLDSMTANRATNGAMATWLRADIASTTNTWIIAFWHHPPYTKGSHNSDTETALLQMRENFGPILEAGGTDLVLSGHSHSYERSYFLAGHYGVSTTLTSAMKLNSGSGNETNSSGPYTKWTASVTNQGTVYAVPGSSGKISSGPLNHPAMFISVLQLGSMVLDIDSDSLRARFLRENGVVIDDFTIVKRDIEFSLIQPVGNAIQLQLTNVAASKTNILQSSVDLAEWMNVHTNVNVSNRWNYLDTSLIQPAKMYRVLRLP